MQLEDLQCPLEKTLILAVHPLLMCCLALHKQSSSPVVRVLCEFFPDLRAVLKWNAE